jgi:TBC1 domain family member 8/9
MDSRGYVKITGRIKDMIIRGGENISPLEVENCILAHDSVVDASVVGVPDERHGEAVVAFVILSRNHTLSIKEVRDWVGARLSRHLVPKYVFFVDGYPKTASGKVQKFVLRNMAAELVNEGKGTE